MNRRDWTRSVAAGLAFGGLLDRNAMCAEENNPVIVDTHLHCFAGASDARFPYHERGPYQPAEAATPEHLLKCMDEGGVDYAIVVHPEPYQDDHRYLEHCLEVGGDRVKGVCLFFADQPGSVEQMKPLVERHPGKIVAARVHAYAPGRLPPFGSKELRHYWQTATDLGLAMQLHFEPRYAPGFEPLIRDFADTTVIIDHLGRPMQGTVEEHDVVIGWAKYPNTIMKIAALPDQTKYPHRDVRPIIKRLTEEFGPDRMICGGGFGASATGQSYIDYRARVADLLSHLSGEEQAKIFGSTAAALFKFDRAGT